MKLTLFTWIPASSAGMTILLFAAQLNAAGVCIVCPPGYVCAAGEAPTLTGTPGQILTRTATGTEWTNAVDFMSIANTALCNQARIRHDSNTQSTCSSSPHSADTGELGRHCFCRMDPPFISHHSTFPDCSYNPFVHVYDFADLLGPNGCTGGAFSCARACRENRDWRIQS